MKSGRKFHNSVLVGSLLGIALWLSLSSKVQAGQAQAKVEGNRPVLQGLDLFGRDEDSRISILVEAGEMMPKQILLWLDRPRSVALTVVSGDAEFFYARSSLDEPKRMKAVRYGGTEVFLPELFAGEALFSESLIQIEVDDVSVGDLLRVSTLGANIVPDIWAESSSLRPAILRLGNEARYVIADPNRIDARWLEEDAGKLKDPFQGREFTMDAADSVGSSESQDPCQFSSLRPKSAAIQEEGDYRCPELVWYRPEASDPPFRINSCLSNLKIVGSAEFVGINPPAGFSMKPERSSPLFIPNTSIVSGIDGIYRSSWGCGIALKVPGNVVARLFATTASCCAGVAALALGKTCTWLTTTELNDWPNCPL